MPDAPTSRIRDAERHPTRGVPADQTTRAAVDMTGRASPRAVTRSRRHYDLSIQFITQTGGEFSLSPETRTISNLCSLTMLHRVDESAEKLVEWFDLTEREANWVRTAKAGDDDSGYSEALLGIGEEGWFPVRIRANPAEQVVIEGERLDSGL